MSAVLQEAGVPANDETVEVLDRAEIRDGKAVVEYSRTEAAIAALTEKYKGVTYDLTTVAGDKAARAARLELVTIGARLEDKRKELKAPALSFGRLVDSEATRLLAMIEALKAPINKQIKDDEDRREREREEKRLAEAARKQVHIDAIARIRKYADDVRRSGMTSERALKGLSQLEAMKIGEGFEEYKVEALAALTDTISSVKAEYESLVEKEAEASRLALQAKEQAERAAELRQIEQDQAARQAELDRQAQELQEAKRAAVPPAATVAVQPMTQPQESPEVIPVAEVIEHSEAPATDGRMWTVGQLSSKFGGTFTAARFAELGFEPDEREGRSVRFSTPKAMAIRDALAAALLNVSFTEA